ncbi:CRISPR-associated helicase/endonuclease Cas3 [Nostoc minutum NIES-26]|uniref:CRISPR-associated helicase/endonuclease Cas3 n=1 Tax=Nostoc minutum NIES-26 TaxID=1844469 RepID=A0A367QUR8_9NOSO|nr:CRISPR-associated helicase/endonuclease Cas3 [Nostoc minutum NIES-26]
MRPNLEPDFLLAKSREKPWRGAYTLVGHTVAVVEAVTTLVDVLGDRLISQFGLQCSLSHLRGTARLAAYLHDWGKANDHFQMVVRKNRNPLESPQLIRHEVASVLLAYSYREWLQQCEGNFYTALSAAGGHHLKFGGNAKKGDTGEIGEIRSGSGSDRIYLYTDTKNFKALLKYGVKTLGLPRELKLPRKRPTCWTVTEIKTLQNEVLEAFCDWPHDTVFASVVKALLVAGDSVGSAIPPTGLKIKTWIKQELSTILDIKEIQQVIDSRLGGKELLNFQINLGNSSKRVTLARAGCGTGKTLGAYNWAKQYAVGGKLFFCYPTTGTSTEGFLDYVHDEISSVLLHSRADVDLELATTGEEAEAGDNQEDELAKKLESFQTWGTKVSICTVDTVLGLQQCNRRPLYCFPAIAQSAFVFDEVHCYDERLFGGLLRFLEVVKAPILLMSASFLPWQLEAIKKAVGEPIEIIPGPKELEKLPRYRFNLVDTPDWQRVEQELTNKGKVLWVCNQVGTAIDIYREAKSRGLNALLYHSRYRYEDRVKHHRDVVDAFKKDEPVLAIATQVAEMSLDLSATLLVSQIADPPGLIQRLGRLNRRYSGHALDAFFYPDTKTGFPYSKDNLKAGKEMIEAFTGEVSQADLAAWLENNPNQENPDKETVLFNTFRCWQMYPAPCRKAGHTITALLEQDLPQIEKMSAKLLPRYTVPLLLTKDVKEWPRHTKGYLIASADKWGYSEELGAYEI